MTRIACFYSYTIEYKRLSTIARKTRNPLSGNSRFLYFLYRRTIKTPTVEYLPKTLPFQRTQPLRKTRQVLDKIMDCLVPNLAFSPNDTDDSPTIHAPVNLSLKCLRYWPPSRISPDQFS